MKTINKECHSLVGITSGESGVPLYSRGKGVNRRVRNGFFLAFGDVLCYLLSFPIGLYFGQVIRVGSFSSGALPSDLDVWGFRIITLAVLGAGWILWFWLVKGHYLYRRSYWQEMGEIWKTVLVMALLEAAMLYAAKVYFSRLTWAVGWFSVALTVPLMRFCVKKTLLAFGQWQRITLIVGTGQNAVEAYHAVRSEALLGFDVRGFVSANRPVEHLADSLPAPLFPSLAAAARSLGAGHDRWHLVVALESHEMGEHAGLINRLSALDADLTVAPPLRGFPLHGLETTHFFSHEVLLLHVRNNLARTGPVVTKRIFDMLGAFVGLVFLSPFFLAVAWLIRRDGAPAFYRHPRIGRRGHGFKCLKFRTMRSDADTVLHQLLARNAQARQEWERDFKLREDPRVTPLGKFLRRTSLDELPQLFNVFVGQMSLVGPRPVVEEELKRYGDSQRLYKEARPGITGLWQVSGRNNADYSRRVALDSWYVRNWSLWIDIVILVKTIRSVLKREGAY